MSITLRDCPRKLCLNFPACLENLACTGGPEVARLMALGHQGAPGKRRPEQRDGCGPVAAAPGRAPGVGELPAECVWPPGRRARTGAVARALQLGARTARPLQPFVPWRLGEASHPGRDKGTSREREDSERVRAGGDRPAPTAAPLISESPTLLQSLSPGNPLLPETPFLPFCGSGPAAWGLQDRADHE